MTLPTARLSSALGYQNVNTAGPGIKRLKEITMPDKISCKLEEFLFHGHFPDACIYCGKPKVTELEYSRTVTVQEKKDEQKTSHEIKLLIPYCKAHMKIARRNKNIDFAIKVVAIVVAVLAAVPVYIHTNERGIFGFKEGVGLFVFGMMAVISSAVIAFWGCGLSLFFSIGAIIKKTTGYPIDVPPGVDIETDGDTKTINFVFQNQEIETKFKEENGNCG